MSGGHFAYSQRQIDEMVRTIHHDLNRRGKKNDYGEVWDVTDETANAMRFIADWLELAGKMAHDLDWCMSGDTSEDTLAKQMVGHYRAAIATMRLHDLSD